MIEVTVLNYLSTALSVPCYMEKPVQTPESYVLVEKTGSGESNFIYTAVIAVQSYAPSLDKAAEINLEVKRVMEGITALDQVTRCRLNTDYNFTNPETKQYRYQAVFDLSHYRE